MANALQDLDRAMQDRYGTAACPNVVWFDLVTMNYAYQS
jgi:hypothetical protein